MADTEDDQWLYGDQSAANNGSEPSNLQVDPKDQSFTEQVSKQSWFNNTYLIIKISSLEMKDKVCSILKQKYGLYRGSLGSVERAGFKVRLEWLALLVSLHLTNLSSFYVQIQGIYSELLLI